MAAELIRRGDSVTRPYNGRMEGSNPFGGLFGDPDDLQRRLGEFAEQMQGAQRVAWADNAIKLAVDMTVAAIHTIDLSGILGRAGDPDPRRDPADLPRGRDARARGARGSRLARGRSGSVALLARLRRAVSSSVDSLLLLAAAAG